MTTRSERETVVALQKRVKAWWKKWRWWLAGGFLAVFAISFWNVVAFLAVVGGIVFLIFGLPWSIITLCKFMCEDQTNPYYRTNYPVWFRIFAFVGGKIDAWKSRRNSVGS